MLFRSIVFEVIFDEPITGFGPDDIDFTGSTAPGTLAAAIGGTGPTYQVLVSGMTDSGLIVVSIPANAAIDTAGNQNEASTSTDNSVIYDVTPPTVTINQGSSQADPTNSEPIVFDVQFSEEVIGFDETDLIVSGMVNPPVIVINGASDAYTVEISGLSDGETVTVDVSENSVVDTSGNENSASTSTDNSVEYDITAIQIMDAGVIGWPGNQIIEQDKKYPRKFNEIEINFDSDAYDPAGDDESDDVTNPDNYYLLQPGENGEFDVMTCTEAHDLETSGLDDISIPVGPVTYENNSGNGPFIATLVVNDGKYLQYGKYRLMLCGSTSITDLAENPLNNGEDVILDFTLYKLPDELPVTGFKQGGVTLLPEQVQTSVYSSSEMVQIGRASCRERV